MNIVEKNIFSFSLLFSFGVVFFINPSFLFLFYTFIFFLLMLEDYKTQEISSFLILLLSSLVFIKGFNLNYEISIIENLLNYDFEPLKIFLLTIGGFYFFVFILETFLNKNLLGSGDLPIIGTISVFVGFKLLLFVMFFSSIFLIFISLLKKKNKLPLLPFLFFSMILSIILDYYFNIISYI